LVFVVVHDIPLLAETGRADSFDAVLVVDADPEEQVRRAVRDRGWTEEEARARVGAQAGRDERLAIATHVIENTGTLEELRRRVEEVYAELQT
jgi:dephospho-CoA kinase